MAISDSQKVDLLFKKVGYGVSKTDTSTYKGPTGEANASPLVSPGTTIYQQDYAIPSTTTLPTSNSSVVTVYRDSLTSTVQCVKLPTTSANVSWTTGLTDWIPVQYGTGYQVKLYAGPAGSSTPQNYTSLSAGGSGNNDDWNFDYQAGIVNFADTNVPTAANQSGNVVYVVGARYTGVKGITTFANLTAGNVSINGNTISSSSGNITIAADLFVTGNTTLAGYSDITVLDSILNLHTQSNLAPWTANDGKDIGIKMHYYDGQDSHAGLVRANDTGFLEWYARGIEGYGNVFQGNAYGTIKTGEMWISNSTSSTSTSTGALRIAGGAGVAGNVFVGNILTNGYYYANSSPVGWMTRNDVTAYLPTYTGNISAGNVIVQTTVYANTISANTGNIVTVAGTGALKLPIGTVSDRPTGQNGLIRFNTDIPALEYFDGTLWVPVTNTVTDQQITPDGTSTTYTLTQQANTVGVMVSINGVLQIPTVAYSVSGDQITFTETPQSTDIVDIRFLGAAVTINSTLTDDLAVSGNLTVTGNVTLTGILSAPQVTKTSTSTGTVGQITWDANYIYICTATNTWKRVALSGGVF